MSEPDKQLKKQLAQFLSAKGLKVEEIPTARTKTPDFFVKDEKALSMLIEVKQKKDDAKEVEDYKREIEIHGRAERSRYLGYRNAIDSLVENGTRQLKQYDKEHKHIHLLWIHCEGHFSRADKEQIESTIYGTQKLISEEVEFLITCYYFKHSSFFRFKNDLDAIIVSIGNEAFFYGNDFSPLPNALVTAKFSSIFEKCFYPKQNESNTTMILDCKQPLKTEEEKINFLLSKYKLQHLQIFDMGLHEIGYLQNSG
jgi:hypothetical protein